METEGAVFTSTRITKWTVLVLSMTYKDYFAPQQRPQNLPLQAELNLV